jgi:hypothetical protein
MFIIFEIPSANIAQTVLLLKNLSFQLLYKTSTFLIKPTQMYSNTLIISQIITNGLNQ